MRKRVNKARNIAAAFLEIARSNQITAELVDVFPRDIEVLLLFTLALPVEYLKPLTVHSAEQYLCALDNIPYAPSNEPDRDLIGLLCIGPPTNVVFIKSDLPKHVQNYVLAHEVAHFLVDVFLLRNLWVNSLPERQAEILKAFDWQAYDDWLDFEIYLKGLPIRSRSIIARGKHQLDETDEKELEADLVARELILPWEAAMSLYRSSANQEQFIADAFLRFMLPRRVAFYYYEDLRRFLTPAPNLFDSLFSTFSDSDKL